MFSLDLPMVSIVCRGGLYPAFYKGFRLNACLYLWLHCFMLLNNVCLGLGNGCKKVCLLEDHRNPVYHANTDRGLHRQIDDCLWLCHSHALRVQVESLLCVPIGHPGADSDAPYTSLKAIYDTFV